VDVGVCPFQSSEQIRQTLLQQLPLGTLKDSVLEGGDDEFSADFIDLSLEVD
jgi:hypothetical protein